MSEVMIIAWAFVIKDLATTIFCAFACVAFKFVKIIVSSSSPPPPNKGGSLWKCESAFFISMLSDINLLEDMFLLLRNFVSVCF